ncbi:hypothetical protein LFYK43_12130 [Ligilactobacillus salitolerans]|uniref:Uncharacterized protein n=1 Tax=Ligilactobacillus salitolerans TaxID=1808352 RepID=A0A401ITB0_9LACO|nr:hypothetical protein [Ligilactobacillus salitolerans]GBG94754.1 hypothetical protein LFYK43_12130 [Ligilactobacillus salitolerans]
MSDYEIKFTVDGREVTQQEIRDIELERYHHVFQIFTEKQLPIALNGKALTEPELMALPLADAKVALAQTREAMGKEKTLEVFKPETDRADQMWGQIADSSRAGVNMQPAYVEVDTKNITLVQFMLFNQLLAKKNNLYLPSTIHPEHYYFEAGAGGKQTIIETFGMYQDPTYMDLRPGGKEDFPVEPDPDVDLVMAGKTYTMSNGKDTKMIGMHQLTEKPDGMHVKLGVFLPEGAPKEIAEGHKKHLLVEFNNGLHIAAEQKPSFVQKKVLGAAIKKMKSKIR